MASRFISALFVCFLSVSYTVHCTSDSSKEGKLFNSKLRQGSVYKKTIQNSLNKLNRQKIQEVDLRNEARELTMKLQQFTNSEIGLTKIQKTYDKVKYAGRHSDEHSLLLKLKSRVQKKVKLYADLLLTNRRLVENLYWEHLENGITQQLDCCSLNETQLRYNEQYKGSISHDMTCDLVPSTLPQNTFNPGRNLTQHFQSNLYHHSKLIWQYFMSTSGVHNEYPAHTFSNNQLKQQCTDIHNSRHRDVFISAVTPQRKHIVIVIDHGNSLSPKQLSLAKFVGKHVLQSLSENDRVTVFAVSDKVAYMSYTNTMCLQTSLVPSTLEAKELFSTFITDLQKQDTPANHTLAFERAFELIKGSIHANETFHNTEEAMIMYISRGLMSSITEAHDVLNTISIHNGALSHRVVINTYAVIEAGRPVLYEENFLQALAGQNFAKHHVPVRHPNPVKQGQFVPVTSSDDLSTTAGQYYKAFSITKSRSVRFSLPYMDITGQGLIVSVSQACFHEEEVIGIVGIDLNLADLMEDVTYFEQDIAAYPFIVNKLGYTIMHPTFNRPIMTMVQPMHTDIHLLENYPGFTDIRSHMLREDAGARPLLVVQNTTMPVMVHVKYTWSSLENTPYVVCIKWTSQVDNHRHIKPIAGKMRKDIIYHRLDLVPTDRPCMHLKQLATKETPVLFLSASGFEAPFDHLSQLETKRMVQAYTVYLNDDTGLVSNPGLKDGIRDEVEVLGTLDDIWQKQATRGSLKEYIIRRYVATPSGIMKTLPGGLLDKAYDPTKQPWYLRAMEYPGHVTLTAPYLDTAGAGYITSISRTVYEGKLSGQHGWNDKASAVLGFDVRVEYIYKMIIELMPVCTLDYIRCFILDNEGYLIAHKSLLGPNIERKHITMKEPLVSNDILHHKQFAQKRMCNSYNERKIERYYFFNTSMEGTLSNLFYGFDCSPYEITSIPGTNVFLGIINQTCDDSMFCPCNKYVDMKGCFSCTMRPDCECPCECKLDVDLCSGGLTDKENRNPGCLRKHEETVLISVGTEVSEKLPRCMDTKCEDRKTKHDCFGVVDCEWCHLSSGGTANLTKPFCSSQRVCYGGVIEAKTPYDDQITRQVEQEVVSVKSTPVGPVAGGIMGCFLLLALGVYCYRHRVHQNNQYVCAENNVQIVTLDNDIEDIDEGPSGGHTNKIVLATFDQPISPYRMNAHYQRPTGIESDHGYSTMTPQDDSERASTCIIEPIMLQDLKPSSEGATPTLPPPPKSRSRRAQSPPLKPCDVKEIEPLIKCDDLFAAGQTVLPELPNNIVLANVTVHMAH